MVDIGIAGDDDDVARIPAEGVHPARVMGRKGARFRSADGGDRKAAKEREWGFPWGTRAMRRGRHAGHAALHIYVFNDLGGAILSYSAIRGAHNPLPGRKVFPPEAV